MSEDKEAFLSRWSRLKTEQEARARQPGDAALPAAPQGEAPALPPVETLTVDSDFAAFMHPKVADGLRRAALKKLFSDPQFNVPDPYEAYSGDFTAGDPISEELMKQLYQGQQLLFAEEKKEQQVQQAQESPKAEAKEEDGAGRQDT